MPVFKTHDEMFEKIELSRLGARLPYYNHGKFVFLTRWFITRFISFWCKHVDSKLIAFPEHNVEMVLAKDETEKVYGVRLVCFIRSEDAKYISNDFWRASVLGLLYCEATKQD